MPSSTNDLTQKTMLEFDKESDECRTEGDKLKIKTRKCGRDYRLLIFLCVLLLIGIILLIISFVKMKKCEDTLKEMLQEDAHSCSYSEEAKRVELGKFMEKIKEVYYEVFPEEIVFHPESNGKMIRERFRIHDPKPENLKRISDRADSLLDEGIRLNPDLSKLKPREHKAYLQAKHFLESTFANPYLKYKSGLWMLGPSSFCGEMICNLGFAIYNSVAGIVVADEDDVNRIMSYFRDFNQSVYDYIDILEMGIKKGMVRTQLECKAGLDVFKLHHANISINGAKGIKGQWYAERFFHPDFYQDVKNDLNELFLRQHGLNVSHFLQKNIEDLIGKPIEKLLKYLENDHYMACRPNNKGAGGLSALPIDVIYHNGSVKSGSSTSPYLPLCDDSNCRLNGSNAYASLLGYFTTKDIDPLSVHEMGWENVRRIYPQMIEIAKNVTSESDEEDAVKEFKKILDNLKLSYFHDEPLPENETNGVAHAKCTSDETAKKYCPKRWAAMSKWFRFAQMTMSLLDPSTIDFFYFTGEHHSTPNCPIKLRADYNPSSGAQSYDGSDSNCTRPCYYNIPFFLEHLGPKYSEYSVNAHEARPGHHTQVQGLTENFGDRCGGPESWLQQKTYYTAFTEGWALYGESPLIAQGTDIYKDNLMQKYGMLKWQMWRALRLVVDTGLHFKKYSRAKALELFEKYAWDNTDLSRKEVTRYQSNYGQATAYMIGQLDIWQLRNRTEEKLQEKFSMKEFHLQTLSQGSSPLAFLESHLKKYTDCKLSSSQQYCDIVLNPAKASRNLKPTSKRTPFKQPQRRHYL